MDDNLLLSGTAFRKAARNREIGPKNLIKVYDKLTYKQTSTKVEDVMIKIEQDYCPMIERIVCSKVENKMKGAFSQVGVTETEILYDDQKFALVSLLATYEKEDSGAEDSDSGSELGDDIVEQSETKAHSYIHLETGDIFLPSTDKADPVALNYGIRGNIFLPQEDIIEFCFDKKNGMVKSFRATIRELLALNIDVNAADVFGYTALMQVCIQEQYLETCEILIKEGKCDINLATHCGTTALMIAIDKGGKDSIEIIKLLLDNGADPKKTNQFNKSSFDIAEKKQLNEIKDLLLKYTT